MSGIADLALEKAIKKIADEQIHKGVLDALNQDPTETIKCIVDAAMSLKHHNYDSKTIFQIALEEMITKTAREVMKAWIEENSEVIKTAIEKRLKMEKSTFIEAVADQIVTGMAKSFYVSCHLEVES